MPHPIDVIVGKRIRLRRLQLSLSQTELAGMINATRERVNRCLSNWQRQGIVDVSERWITILERDVLEVIVESS